MILLLDAQKKKQKIIGNLFIFKLPLNMNINCFNKALNGFAMCVCVDMSTMVCSLLKDSNERDRDREPYRYMYKFSYEINC